jgi:hypothetical protein
MHYRLDHVRRDVRDAVRSLARRPGFTAVAVLSLGIGIGANTAIFTLVNAIVLLDTPVERPERVVNHLPASGHVRLQHVVVPESFSILGSAFFVQRSRPSGMRIVENPQ